MSEADGYKVYPIDPVPKPRMTQRDKWKQRPCVMRYRAFKDEVRLRKVSVPKAGAHVIFALPMPKSWPKARKLKMAGLPHEQKPDVDNLIKALLDGLYTDDSVVSDIRISKVWAATGAIAVGEMPC